MLNKIKINALFQNVILFFGFLYLFSCSGGQMVLTNSNDLVHIRKGEPFSNFIYAKKYDQTSTDKNRKIDSFEFEYQNKKLSCNIVKVINNISKGYSGTRENRVTEYTLYQDSYYVITDNGKENLVITAFYKYEIVNGTRKFSDELLEKINEGYYNYLVKNNIYTLDEIKVMSDYEKETKLKI